MKQRCEIMKELEKKHDSFHLYKEIRYTTGTYRKKIPASLIAEDGKYAIEVREKLQLWTKYIEDLYNDERIDFVTDGLNEEELYPILRSEVDYTIGLGKPRAATGPDELPTEIIQLLDNENIQ